jgi:hypothetical protein
VIVGLLDQSSGLEDILVNEDSRNLGKADRIAFRVGWQVAQPTGAWGNDDDCLDAKDDGFVPSQVTYLIWIVPNVSAKAAPF